MNTPILQQISLHLNDSPVQIPCQLNHHQRNYDQVKTILTGKKIVSFAVNQLSSILCILIDVNIREGQRERSICKYEGQDPKIVRTKAR